MLGLRDPIVLALPRGGVPVAARVASRLDAPLEVFVATKIGMPGQPELGIGAVAEGGAVVRSYAAPPGFERLAEEARQELERRVARYRGERALPPLEGRNVVLVDDGLATGVTAEAALLALRQERPARLVLAAPVGAPDTVQRLGGPGLADEIVCLERPGDLGAVGRWYDDFTQTTDEEVAELLAQLRLG